MKRIINPWLNLQGYNCICCSPTNNRGLHLEFFEDGDDILTFWTPTDDFQSWVNTLHGGIQAMLMDEVAGWVVTRKLRTTGVTSKMDIQYLKPVSTKLEGLVVRAHLAKQMRNVAFIDAQIENPQGEVLSKSTLTYFCASREKAMETMNFSGCEVEDEEILPQK